MGERLGVLVLHGTGAHQPGYSEHLLHELEHRLGERARRLVWEEVVWADALQGREDRLWTGMRDATEPDGAPLPLAWQPLRQFLLRFFGDAIAYHRDEHPLGARVAIHDIISNHLAHLHQRLDDGTAPLVIIAHSLGGQIISDYIWDRQHHGEGVDSRRDVPTLAGLITFGCPIPLFSLAYDVPVPIELPGPVTHPTLRKVARWLNFLDRDDVVAWPLKPLYARHLDALSPAQQETVSRIEDREIDVGGPITRWNPASHEAYWTDDDFILPVADYLDTLLRRWPGTATGETAP